jgi:hypothetical protein
MKYFTSLIIVISFFFFSCEQSSRPLIDGFTLNGSIIDTVSGKSVPSVLISIGYGDSIDSAYFSGMSIISDTSGKFIFKGGIGTAPSDEILRFEHENHTAKDILLRNSATREGEKYSLLVYLLPK